VKTRRRVSPEWFFRPSLYVESRGEYPDQVRRLDPYGEIPEFSNSSAVESKKAAGQFPQNPPGVTLQDQTPTFCAKPQYRVKGDRWRRCGPGSAPIFGIKWAVGNNPAAFSHVCD